jgi:hypothetical protein
MAQVGLGVQRCIFRLLDSIFFTYPHTSLEHVSGVFDYLRWSLRWGLCYGSNGLVFTVCMAADLVTLCLVLQISMVHAAIGY